MHSTAAARRFASGAAAGAPHLSHRQRGPGGRLHLIGAFFLLFTLVAPIAQITALNGASAANAPAAPAPQMNGSYQAPPGSPPPIPAPSSAALEGSFQTALGCPTDFDASCPITQLSEHRGVFTAALPVPPGNYEFRVATQGPAGFLSLGEDGDPSGDNIDLDVPGDAAGVYFSYDYRTGLIVAEPYEAQVTIQGDFGTFNAEPIGRGNYEVFFSTQAGTYQFQILVNNQPVGGGQIALDFNARVHLVVDDEGNISVQEAVPQAGLTVVKTDQNGNPLPGACFALFDGNDLATQACDVDDGEDGSTFLLFLNGIPGGGGTFELIETFTPDGQETAESQNVSLGNGEFNQVQAIAGGGEGPGPDETQEPGPDETQEPPPGDGSTMLLYAVDAETQSQPLPGACFESESGDEFCDADDGANDGVTTLTGLDNGPQNVTETEAPEGFESVGTFQVNVFDGAQYLVPHEESAGPPTEEPVDELARVNVESRDDDGNLLPGACYSGVNAIGPYGPNCDEDGDGVVEFSNLGPGEQQISLESPPPGYELDDEAEKEVDVDGGETETVVFEFTAEAAPATEEPSDEPGSIRILIRDENGDPITDGTASYTVTNFGGTFGPFDDSNNNDGQIILTGVPAGENTVTEESPPDGYVNTGDTAQTVVVNPGEESVVTFTYAPEDQPQPEGPGTLSILIRDTDGNEIPTAGAEYRVTGEQGEVGTFTDENGDGQVFFDNLPAGEYTVEEVSPPDGYENAGETSQTVEVEAGEDASVTFAYQEAEEPQPEGPGTLSIQIRGENDDDEIPTEGAAYRLLDEDGDEIGVYTDQNGDGRVFFDQVPAGEYTVEEVSPPDGYELIGDAAQTIEVEPGENEVVVFNHQEEGGPAPEFGTLTILTEDENGDSIPGGCYTVENSGGLWGPFCDNEGDGRIVLADVVPGDNTVREDQPPPGDFQAAEVPEQIVNVAPGEDETVTFVYPSEEAPQPEGPGTLAILIRGIDGDEIPTEGAAYRLLDEDGDEIGVYTDQNGDGRVFFDQVPAGEYTVEEVSPPDGYENAGETSQTVEVEAGEDASVTFAYQEAEEPQPETGVLRYVRTDAETGEPVPGGCILLEGQEVFGPVCDNEEGDADDDPGVIEVRNLPADTYLVSEPTPADGYSAPAADFATIGEGETEDFEVEVESLAPPTADLVVIVTDGEGNPVGGTCFELLDEDGDVVEDEVCDEDGDVADDGRVGFLGVEVGSYNLRQTESNPDYLPTDDLPVTVPEGGIQVDVTNPPVPPEEGDLLITRRNGDNERVTGGCYAITNADGETIAEACDNDANDANNSDGRIRFNDLPVGPVTVTETVTPPGLQPVEPQGAEISSEETARVEFVSGPSLGSMTIFAEDVNGEPLGLACYQVDNGAGSFGPFCDDENGTGDGQVILSEVFPGENTISVVTAPAGYATPAAQTVNVTPGEESQVFFTFERAVGALEITKLDENGDELGGTCWSLLDGNGQSVLEVCDNDENDADGDDGQIRIEGILAGDYTLTETAQPDGYIVAADQPVTIDVDETTEVEVTNTPSGGVVEIVHQDENGAPIEGGCFSLQGDQSYGPICDNDENDADDTVGVIRFEGVAAGDYEIIENEQVQGVGPAEVPESVSVEAGQVETVTVVSPPLPPEPGSVEITKVDPDGNLLPDACFSLQPLGDGDPSGPVCDNEDGDENDQDGIVLILQVPAGDYQVVEETAPEGYQLTDEIDPVTVSEGETATIEVVNEPLPEESGAIEITKTDPEGNLLEGACFSVLTEAGELLASACDNEEGDGDDEAGVILLEGIPAGNHQLVEDTAPEGHLGAGELDLVEVTAGETAEIEVVNEPQPPPSGTVVVYKSDENDQPFGGTCFALLNADEESVYEACDDAEGDAAPETPGTIRFEGVAPGEYTLRETETQDGYVSAEDQPVTVTEGVETTVGVQNLPEVEETGSLEITKTDEDDELLGGACFGLSGPVEVPPVCDNDTNDQNPEVGLILIGELAPGDYTLTETQAPPDYVAAPSQTVTIEAGEEPTTVTVVNSATPPPVGSVVVLVEDPEGAPLPDACVRLTAADGSVYELCDGAPNDPEIADGALRFDGVVEGEATVEQFVQPEGYLLPDPATQTVDVVADQFVEVTFVNEPEDTTGQVGGLQLDLRDPNGDPATTDAPFFLRRWEGNQEVILGPFVDNGEGDADDRPGYVLLENVPVGTWSVIYQSAPPVSSAFSSALPGAKRALPFGQGVVIPAGFSERSVTIQVNVIIIIIIIIIVQPDDDGDLLVTKRDIETNLRLPGSCFRIEQVDDPSTAYGVCDNDFTDVDVIDAGLTPLADGDLTPGRLRFDNVPIGSYTVSEILVPAGYIGGDPVDAEVESIGLESVTVYNTPIEDPLGDLVVYKIDPDDDPVPGACFELRNPAGTQILYGEVCDDDDGDNDGQISFTDVAAGQYRLHETDVPDGYVGGPDQLVHVIAGDVTEVYVVNQVQPGRVIIEKRAEEEDGDLLPGACFRLDGRDGAPDYAELCDDDDGSNDGRTRFNGVQPGEYTAVETETPAGYQNGDDQDFDVGPGETVTLVFVNEELPPPPQTGDLIVYKVDPYGQPLPGACFSLRNGAVTVAGPICDSSDGVSDGIIRFENVGIGTYTLRETRRPSADYLAAPDRQVTIEADETAEVTVKNELRPGRVLVIKKNKQGQLLQGACFDLAPDGRGPKCTNADGEIVFDNLTPGNNYSLTETKAPPGYIVVPKVTGIVVKPGATTIITIIEPPRPPDPNTGSIRITKFFCPAGKGGEFTTILDSSNPGGAQLAQTAGCTPGKATFTLTRVGGEGGPGTIQTGADGVFQATLPAGTYRLTETNPQLGNPAGRTEDIVISKGQQTTVIVINYVRPPAPAPVDIVVIKFTCDPGFAGTLYADFLNNCGAERNLTNNITFRLSGQANGKGITGDGGERGVTGFFRIPAGGYTLKEEAPANTTVHIFCGLDRHNPTLRTVSNQIGFELKPGQRIYCTFFNVPAEVTDNTGSIIVYKFTCPVEIPPAGYDFSANCKPQQFSVQFSLSIYNGESRRWEPKTTGATNADGIVRFDRLQPGTYQLKEIGEDWCFAESNSVNANGDVIVRPNRLAEVWIYNCHPTKGPPNTGIGAAALATSGGTGGLTLLFGLVWPLLGAAAWQLRRNRRRVA